MAISNPTETRPITEDDPLGVNGVANMLMHGVLAHFRQLQAYVRTEGILALEAELGADSLERRIGSLIMDDAPDDRVTNLTCLALRSATKTTADSLRSQSGITEQDQGYIPGAVNFVIGNGVASIKESGKLRGVIRPVYRREIGRSPSTEDEATVATNSAYMITRKAGRSRHLTGPADKHGRRKEYQHLQAVSYEASKFTFIDTPAGLALAYSDPEAVRELTLEALSQTSSQKPAGIPHPQAQCPTSQIMDAEGSLALATWQLQIDTFVADAEATHLDRLGRDAKLVIGWAASRLRR